MKYDDPSLPRDELLQTGSPGQSRVRSPVAGGFCPRVVQADLRGPVILYGADELENRPNPVLVAVNFSQALIQEHFLPEEIAELHSVLSLVHDADHIMEAKFALEEIGRIYVPALHRILEMKGVFLGDGESVLRHLDPNRDSV